MNFFDMGAFLGNGGVADFLNYDLSVFSISLLVGVEGLLQTQGGAS